MDIPSDAGVLFLFPAGWRKGLYFDFRPVNKFGRDSFEDRDYDLSVMLGHLFARLAFQHLFKITDVEWTNLFAGQWFPFVSLGTDMLKKILAHLRNGWDVDEHLPKISDQLCGRLDRLLQRWDRNRYFQPHRPLIAQAVERYRAGDFVSSTAILYPRIEGVMRSFHVAQNPTTKATQANLVSSAVPPGIRHASSLLIPDRFRQYMNEVYFANFDPAHANIAVSRNSVSHGVASCAQYNLKAATLGLLILEQLLNYFDGSTGFARDTSGAT